MLNGTKPCAVNLIIEKNSDIFPKTKKDLVVLSRQCCDLYLRFLISVL